MRSDHSLTYDVQPYCSQHAKVPMPLLKGGMGPGNTTFKVKLAVEDGDEEDGDEEDGDKEDGDKEDGHLGDEEDGDKEDGDKEDGHPHYQRVSHSNPALRNAKNQFDKLAIFLCEKKRERDS
jgi:hypothetical protein